MPRIGNVMFGVIGRQYVPIYKLQHSRIFRVVKSSWTFLTGMNLKLSAIKRLRNVLSVKRS